MALPQEQVPLHKALELTRLQAGLYTTEAPRSICFGSVVFGGYLADLLSKAAVSHISASSKTENHRHILQSSFHFLRPTFPTPKKIFLHVTVASVNKGWTVVHVEAKQDDKPRVVGYLTLTDLHAPGRITCDSGWHLNPSPPAIDFQAVEMDDPESGWSVYQTPWAPNVFRQPHTYTKHALSIGPYQGHTSNQWLSPAWKTHSASPQPTWTNEMIHFVLDSSIPLVNDLINDNCPLIEISINAGLQQRKARLEGRKEIVFGDRLGPQEVLDWSISTLSLTTHFHKELPAQGVKWLLLHCVTKIVRDDRSDVHIIMLDKGGTLVAESHQVLQVTNVAGKVARKEGALVSKPNL